ncbi:uncharacterized protein LOC141907210 [Tubulanus polymorphus]|uniref:uncharacterized protein LOC141907210 n=1 Tax=Tubulanus polymorphus TaxID=672921 RepID=UPI003DA4903D
MTLNLILIVLAAVATLCRGYWNNDWDQPLDFQCSSGQYINFIRSIHHNGHEDRRFRLECQRGFVGTDCSWTGFLNGWDEVIRFTCPRNGIVTGLYSYHNNGPEDRRWRVRCCQLITQPGRDCRWTEWLADWDQEINYRLSHGTAITGLYSNHHNGNEDRRYKLRICDFANCKAVHMNILSELRSHQVGSRVVGIATNQGCSPDHEFMLSLGSTDSLTETASITSTESKSFVYETTISVTAEASAKFLGSGGSVSFGVAQTLGGSTTWESTYTKETSTGSESSASTEVTFTGPGAALIMGDVKEYKFQSDQVDVEIDVSCDDGRRYKQKDVVNLKMKTYGVTHFSSYTGKFKPDQCSRKTNECIRNLEGDKALTPYYLVDQFKQCFDDIGNVQGKNK